jgi:hypothetical protein
MLLQLLCVYARSEHPEVRLNQAVIDSVEREIKMKSDWLGQVKEIVGRLAVT